MIRCGSGVREKLQQGIAGFLRKPLYESINLVSREGGQMTNLFQLVFTNLFHNLLDELYVV